MKQQAILIGICLCLFGRLPAQTTDSLLRNACFKIQPSRYGLSALWKTQDVYPTNYIRRNRRLGEVTVRYQQAGQPLATVDAASAGATTFSKDGKRESGYTAPGFAAAAVQLSQDFALENNALVWTIRLTNTTGAPVEIKDLALPIFYNNQGGENPAQIFERQLIKHQFIEGHNSYLFWERPTGIGPYLVMTPQPGTALQYFTSDTTQVFQVYIHAAYTGTHQPAGNWRQPLTSLTLPAHGSKTYGFTFHWARNYEDVRNTLVAEQLIDVHVMPGMTIPTNLTAQFALHTKVPVNEVLAEFPGQTAITALGETKPGLHLYKVTFAKRGENRLTIRFNGHDTTYLEFFVTEPLETLYKKRAAFLVSHQQHRDTSKWYDGLFSVWDMKNKVLRGPDNTDGFDGWWGYVLACDDPALCKAPFLAAKNLHYPDQHEIDAIEYYVQHYVWGKLQRTDQEQPYPYGVYGTPNWFTNRDTARRRNYSNQNLDKMHVWRSYDYPHIIMLYYHLYQIADRYPGMTHYLDKKGYLIRAKETAKAYFRYPYEILPWYETYKWGCYNELLLVDLVRDLEKEGYKDDARWLRQEWEKKVKYFIYDDPYPFRSEYAIDATAFESTEAIAAYGVTHTMQPDENLWYDKNLKKWYSHSHVSTDSARAFMERQIQANIACRGWLEPAYYYYGSDYRGRSERYTLSYMAQMGGWGILDYALHYAADPASYLRLGYGSYLSSFALMNTGTAESNYGAWYPGPENDGATGWAFEPLEYTGTWIRKTQGRGPWFYDGEIDLGYGGATRSAATIVTDDPVFGWVAYGGDLTRRGTRYAVLPKDGLQQRLFYTTPGRRLSFLLSRDGWAADRPVLLDPGAGTFQATLENRTADAHTTLLTVGGLPAGAYTLTVNGREQKMLLAAGDNELAIAVAATGPTAFSLKPSKK